MSTARSAVLDGRVAARAREVALDRVLAREEVLVRLLVARLAVLARGLALVAVALFLAVAIWKSLLWKEGTFVRVGFEVTTNKRS
jgi:hypothetical protein